MRIKPYLIPPLLFVLIGPSIGVFVFLVIGAMRIPSFDVAALLLIYGYFAGGVPAFFAGLIYVCAWNLRGIFTRLNVFEFGVLLGSVSGLIAFALVCIVIGGKLGWDDFRIYLIPAIAGAVCGGFAASIRDEAFGWSYVDVSEAQSDGSQIAS